jgi:hypothetical protein
MTFIASQATRGVVRKCPSLRRNLERMKGARMCTVTPWGRPRRSGTIGNPRSRRDEGYQEQMLHHMSAEKCVGETIERRGDGEPDGCETKKEGG